MVREFSKTFIFRNAVCEAGYEWVNREDGKPLLVMRNQPEGIFRSQDLHAGVFREFAELAEPKLSRKRIVDFAGKYGNIYSTLPHSKDEGGRDVWGALLSDWRTEILEMQTLVDLWKQIKTRNRAELSKLIKLTDDGPEYVFSSPKRGLRIQKLSNIGGAIAFPPNDVVLPARCALQIELNTRLRENATFPELVWTEDTKEASGGPYQRIVFRPSNLLSSMWIQFAQAVTEQFQLRRCGYCGEDFQVGPGGRRDDATFCKDVCRVRAWNRDHKDNGRWGRPARGHVF